MKQESFPINIWNVPGGLGQGYTDRNIFKNSYYLVSKTLQGYPALVVLNCFFKVKAFYQKKKICTPRAGNPRNVLLNSRNCQEYFHQCRRNQGLRLWVSSTPFGLPFHVLQFYNTITSLADSTL